MKCITCPDLGRRIDYSTFICNFSGSFLSLEDLEEDISCAKYEVIKVGKKMKKEIKKTKQKSMLESNVERLRSLREKYGLSQVEVARIAGIHPATIWSYEAGKINLSDSRLAQIKAAIKDEMLA